MFDVGIKFGILPIDKNLASIPFSTLIWLYGHILKRELEEREFIQQQVKILAYMINPEAANKIYRDIESDTVINANYLKDIKRVANGKDISKLQSILESLNGRH